MKTLYPFKNLLLVFVIGLCGISCSENIGGQATSGKVITGEVTDVEAFSAVLHGKINVDISMYDKVQFGFMISESKESLKNRNGKEYEAKALIGQKYELEIALSSSTKYYYCAWLLLNGVQYEFGDIKEFETLKETIVFPTPDFVDLGLSVKWYVVYGLYTYSEAQERCENTIYHLPSDSELKELIENSIWTWNGDGYEVTGPNGKSIFLPAAGYCKDGDTYLYNGSHGYYWSSIPYGAIYARCIFFNPGGVIMSYHNRYVDKCSVLLVQN